MSDPTGSDDRPADPPAPPPGFTGPGAPAPANAVPSGFADHAAYDPPNVAAPPTAPRPDARTPARRGRSPLPVIVAVVVVAAVAIGAFILLSGGSDDEAAADGPGDAVLAWASHMADGDYAGACQLMASASVEQIAPKGADCAGALKALDPDGLYAKGDDAKVVTTSVDGTTAQVTLSGGGAALDGKVIVAVKGNGVWKASPFEDGGRGTGDQTEPTPAPNPSDDVNGASAAACQATIATVETAAETYETLNGEPATDVQALVDGGFLRELPPNVEIAPDGSVTGTGPCA